MNTEKINAAPAQEWHAQRSVTRDQKNTNLLLVSFCIFWPFEDEERLPNFALSRAVTFQPLLTSVNRYGFRLVRHWHVDCGTVLCGAVLTRIAGRRIHVWRGRVQAALSVSRYHIPQIVLFLLVAKVPDAVLGG